MFPLCGAKALAILLRVRVHPVLGKAGFNCKVNYYYYYYYYYYYCIHPLSAHLMIKLTVYCRTMRLYKAAFQGYQASNFCFIKFHQLLHYADFLQRFGSVVSTAEYPYEGAIRFFLTNPYKMINRQRDERLLLRIKQHVALVSNLSLLLSLYADEGIRAHAGVGYDVDLPGCNLDVHPGSRVLFSSKPSKSRLIGQQVHLWRGVEDGEGQEESTTFWTRGKETTMTAKTTPQAALDAVSEPVVRCSPLQLRYICSSAYKPNSLSLPRHIPLYN